jgi:hypothetical protein
MDKFKQVARQDRRYGKNWLGHKFTRADQTVHELRCWICGKWFNYSTNDIEKIANQCRWDFRKQRPKHCGNSMCEEWNRRHEAYQIKMQTEKDQYHQEIFLRLKKKRLVS